MTEPGRWFTMKTAPRDGRRVLVTLRASEQGPAQVDVAYWAPQDRSGIEGWRSSDSHPGRIVAYADDELQCWMPLPSANANEAAALPDMPEPFAGEEEELDGSGI